MQNIESPQIVKTLGYQAPFNVMNKVAAGSQQTISNRQAYDVLYPNHQSWYDEKKFIVLDKNFEEYENYILKDFKQALDRQFDYTQTKNIQHVDELDKTQIKVNGLDFGRIPKISNEVLENKSKYTDNYKAGSVKVTSSNPYGEIFKGNYAGN